MLRLMQRDVVAATVDVIVGEEGKSWERYWMRRALHEVLGGEDAVRGDQCKLLQGERLPVQR